jgi:hypothetical protein
MIIDDFCVWSKSPAKQLALVVFRLVVALGLSAVALFGFKGTKIYLVAQILA